jgi:hypothetical protein
MRQLLAVICVLVWSNQPLLSAIPSLSLQWKSQTDSLLIGEALPAVVEVTLPDTIPPDWAEIERYWKLGDNEPGHYAGAADGNFVQTCRIGKDHHIRCRGIPAGATGIIQGHRYFVLQHPEYKSERDTGGYCGGYTSHRATYESAAYLAGVGAQDRGRPCCNPPGYPAMVVVEEMEEKQAKEGTSCIRQAC